MSNLPPIEISPLTTLQWEEIGAWEAGTVVGVALSGTGGARRGLLASRAGIYRWQHESAVVEPMVEGLSDLDVVAVAFAGGDDATPATALAATATGRLFRCAPSNDPYAIDAWQEVSSWAGMGVAVVLAPSPAFAEDQTLFIGTPLGIFRTQDDGQSWESCNFGLLDEDVLCMVCAPNFGESELLWAGTAGGGFYRSRNSARAWRESGFGLPDAAVQSLAVSPNFSEDRTLFAGMEAHGIYVSRDGGENWDYLALAGQSVNTLACADARWLWAGTEDGLWRVATHSGDAGQVGAANEVVLTVAASADHQIAAGLFGGGLLLSDDVRGEPQNVVWQRPTVALHSPPVVVGTTPKLFALDAEGFIARSHDGGAMWSPIESAEGIFALGGGNAEDDTAALFVVTGNGLALWNDAEKKWLESHPDAFQGRTALGVDVSFAFGSNPRLLVITDDGGLLFSQDGGAEWQEITGPWQGQNLLSARFAPDSSRKIVALSVQPTETGHFAVTVWNSNFGQNWEVLASFASGVPAVIVAWPKGSEEEAIFLATQHRVMKLYHQEYKSDLEVHQHFFDESLRVTALATAPEYYGSHTVWAATTGGLYRSVDGGMSWGLMLELPLGLPVVWLDVSLTHVHAITLGGRAWRVAL